MSVPPAPPRTTPRHEQLANWLALLALLALGIVWPGADVPLAVAAHATVGTSSAPALTPAARAP